MNKEELLYFSAYTGILFCEFADFHAFATKLLERPVYTHEMVGDVFWEELKEKARPVVLDICKKAENNMECHWPVGTDVEINGVPVDPCVYQEIEVHRGATVTVSKCKYCGKIDISWVPGEEDEFEQNS